MARTIKRTTDRAPERTALQPAVSFEPKHPAATTATTRTQAEAALVPVSPPFKVRFKPKSLAQAMAELVALFGDD